MHAKRAITRRRPTGFTIIEMIATIVILAIVGSLVSSILMSATSGYSRGATAAQLHGELSMALDRVDRELREIELDQAAASTAPDISAMTASSITWNTDCSLSLSGSNLMLTMNGGTAAVLLSNVTAFTLAAYNESNTALAASLSGSACDPIRRLSVQITTQRYGVTESLRTRVFLRCTVENAG